jgi:hypothetical protein
MTFSAKLLDHAFAVFLEFFGGDIAIRRLSEAVEMYGMCREPERESSAALKPVSFAF